MCLHGFKEKRKQLVYLLTQPSRDYFLKNRRVVFFSEESRHINTTVVIECTSTAVKIFYRPWLQKFVSTVQAHSLARVQGMVYIVLSMSKGTGYGYRTGLRVQGMVYIVLSRSKGTGYGYIVLSISKGAGHGLNYWL